ncbi:hypothetical protein WA158_004399 [Blastocystis sp. Blastoise]
MCENSLLQVQEDISFFQTTVENILNTLIVNLQNAVQQISVSSKFITQKLSYLQSSTTEDQSSTTVDQSSKESSPKFVPYHPVCGYYENRNKNNNSLRIGTTDGEVYTLMRSFLEKYPRCTLNEVCNYDMGGMGDDIIYVDFPSFDGIEDIINFLNTDRVPSTISDASMGQSMFYFLDYFEIPIPSFLEPFKDLSMPLHFPYSSSMNIILYINQQEDFVVLDYLKENNNLSKYISNSFENIVCYNKENNHYYIEDTCEYIQYIHEYIKSSSISIDIRKLSKEQKETLYKEFQRFFIDYQQQLTISESVKEENTINFCGFNTSIIMKPNDICSLCQWIDKDKNWILLYRGSRDGYTASDFHRLCDNRGETVSIIKHQGHDGYINIFGGYTNQSWESSYCYKDDSSAFLFTLSNELKIPPSSYPIKSEDSWSSILCNPENGPQFGYEGNDLSIYNEFHSRETGGSIEICSYTLDKEEKKNSIFTNTDEKDVKNWFIVDDIEVFGIKK